MTEEGEPQIGKITARGFLTAAVVVAIGLVLAWHAEKGSRVAAALIALIPFVTSVYWFYLQAARSEYHIEKPRQVQPRPRLLMSIAIGIVVSIAIFMGGFFLLHLLGIP